MPLMQLYRAWPNLRGRIRANPQIHICRADREDSKLSSLPKYWLGVACLFKLEMWDNKVTCFCFFFQYSYKSEGWRRLITSVCQVFGRGLALNPSGQHTLTDPSTPHHLRPHTTLHALSMRSGNRWRGVQPGVKASSIQGVHLWSPRSSADCRLSTEVSKEPAGEAQHRCEHLTGWFLTAENAYERSRRLVSHWETIRTGSLSAPSGIK